jgi:hypothetical protein
MNTAGPAEDPAISAVGRGAEGIGVVQQHHFPRAPHQRRGRGNWCRTATSFSSGSRRSPDVPLTSTPRGGPAIHRRRVHAARESQLGVAPRRPARQSREHERGQAGSRWAPAVQDPTRSGAPRAGLDIENQPREEPVTEGDTREVTFHSVGQGRIALEERDRRTPFIWSLLLAVIAQGDVGDGPQRRASIVSGDGAVLWQSSWKYGMSSDQLYRQLVDQATSMEPSQWTPPLSVLRTVGRS